MRRVMLIGLVLLLSAGRGLADEETKTPVLGLLAAAKAGLVTVSGTNPNSYMRVDLHLVNETSGALALDLSGGYLEPDRTRSCQRLGLGPAMTPGKTRSAGPGTSIVDLEPGGEAHFQVQTVCLDSGRAAPGNQAFHLGRKPLRAVRRKVLRWWADNIDVPQGCVNSAIWRNAPTVDVWKPSGEAGRVQRKFEAVVHGSARYEVTDGEVMAVGEDGARRFLGTGIERVFPTNDALYATVRGEGGHKELWRYVETGEDRWLRLGSLPSMARVEELIRGPGGAIVLRTETALWHVQGAGRPIREIVSMEERVRHKVAARFAKAGELDVTLACSSSRPYSIWDRRYFGQDAAVVLHRVTLARRVIGKPRTFYNLQGVRAGPAGTYGLTNAGHLRHLVAGKFRDKVGRTWERVAHVGRRFIWMETKSHQLVCLTSAGKLRRTFPEMHVAHVRLDAVTDDLVGVGSRAVWRFSIKTGALLRLSTPRR